MAKRTQTAIVRASTIPTLRIAMPRPANLARTAPRRHPRRASGGSQLTPVKVAITAVVIGMAEKAKLLDSLPEIPIVGRKGAVALGAYYWARHGGGQLARDVCICMAAICGYEYGLEGSISG